MASTFNWQMYKSPFIIMKIRCLRTGGFGSIDWEELFDWNRAWYPISPLDYLDADAPNPVKLLGKTHGGLVFQPGDVVLFFFRMQLSWSSFGDSLGGGWENGKTKNLLVLFVLKHDWKMDFSMIFLCQVR